VDRGKYGAHHRAGDRHLGQLEGDGAGMAHDAGADIDQLELQTGQRPIGHRLGQFDAAQEGGLVVGQCVQLQADLGAGNHLQDSCVKVNTHHQRNPVSLLRSAPLPQPDSGRYQGGSQSRSSL